MKVGLIIGTTRGEPFLDRHFLAPPDLRCPHKLGIASHTFENPISRRFPRTYAHLPHHRLASWAGRKMNN
jgi:hypothetical protein